MQFTFRLRKWAFFVIARRGYYKIIHNTGSFGYYKGQGFWKSN